MLSSIFYDILLDLNEKNINVLFKVLLFFKINFIKLRSIDQICSCEQYKIFQLCSTYNFIFLQPTVRNVFLNIMLLN